LTKARRIDDDPAIDARIVRLVTNFKTAESELIARAFAVYFELINLAEEQYRIQVLRDRERKAHPMPLRESIAAAVFVLIGFRITRIPFFPTDYAQAHSGPWSPVRNWIQIMVIRSFSTGQQFLLRLEALLVQNCITLQPGLH